MAEAALKTYSTGIRPASSAELTMRAEVEAFLRAERPAAAILHEVEVGGCRADIAMVETSRLTLFELKSSRDTLDRAARQMKTFRHSSHHAVLVADAKFFNRSPYDDGRARCVFPNEEAGIDHRVSVWHYPRPQGGSDLGQGGMYEWKLDCQLGGGIEPHSTFFLHLMSREELVGEAKRHGIQFKHRMNMWEIAKLMAWNMTGQQIAEAVCRQLSLRALTPKKKD